MLACDASAAGPSRSARARGRNTFSESLTEARDCGAAATGRLAAALRCVLNKLVYDRERAAGRGAEGPARSRLWYFAAGLRHKSIKPRPGRVRLQARAQAGPLLCTFVGLAARWCGRVWSRRGVECRWRVLEPLQRRYLGEVKRALAAHPLGSGAGLPIAAVAARWCTEIELACNQLGTGPRGSCCRAREHDRGQRIT